MLEYSAEPSYIQGHFLAYRNDIMIFTEDQERDREFYVYLFSRLVEGSVRIRDVIPLGSRKDVLEACHEQRSGSIPELYVIDSDIDLINGGVRESHVDLYPLPVYCCENLLFDENAIIELAYFDCGKKVKADLIKEICFEESVINDFSLIYELFLHFAICRTAGLPFSLRGYEEFLLDPKAGILNSEKIQWDIDCLKYLIDLCRGSEFYQEEINVLRERWPLTLSSISKIISGKDYLVPYAKRLSSKLSGRKAYHSKESLKLRLLSSCDLSQLNTLRQMILAKTQEKQAS